MSIGVRIKEIAQRDFGGVNKLAEKVEIAPSQLSRYIVELVEPGASVLTKMCDLGIDINYILTGKSLEYKPKIEGENMITYKELIKKYCEIKNIKQTDLADMIGVTRQNMSYHFGQAKEFEEELLDKILTKLGLSKTELESAVQSIENSTIGMNINQSKGTVNYTSAQADKIKMLEKIIEDKDAEIKRLQEQNDKLLNKLLG